MRHGRLLIEKCPDALIQEYGTILLEEVVLKLCRKDKLANPNSGDNSSPRLINSNQNTPPINLVNTSNHGIYRFLLFTKA